MDRDRFLRPRGDRPCGVRSRGWVRGVPPPTRRSTPVSWFASLCARGSSAHAEIDPSSLRDMAALSWFLRPRGDRPFWKVRDDAEFLVPPPTRRSTPGKGFAVDVVPGSSAHAEIDPSRFRNQDAPCRFLRPRGDRPDWGKPQALALLVPPPTRRSTRAPGLLEAVKLGSSAHAEIDPRPRRRLLSGGRFLRPRGDRPCAT